MSKEKQIEIEVITYEQDRLNYFTDLMAKANKRYARLLRKFKGVSYMSAEAEMLGDEGRKTQFYNDVVEMLKQDYRKQSEWISVEERLPENENERVLVILKDIPLVDHIGTPKVDTDRYIDGRWVRWDRIITHWMPLPEAPKKGGGGER